jgi:hypothetical protein
VLGDMLFQAGDGHRHAHRQLPLFGRLQLAEPYQPPHPIPRLDELAFEPSMFRTTYRQARSRTHLAPVENRERQITIMAKKKQTLFFALSSPLDCGSFAAAFLRYPSFTTDLDDLPRLDRFEVREAIWNQTQEVFQQHRLSAKNDHRDLSLLQILLVFKSTIDREDNVELCSLGSGQKLTVLKSSKTSVPRSLTVVTGKVAAQSLAHALIEKNPHSRLGG